MRSMCPHLRRHLARAIASLWAAVVLGGCSPSDGERPVSGGDSAAAESADRSAERSTCLVDSTGISPIRLGMSLDDARSALPQATFARASDGDGAALVSVTLAGDAVMTISANEDDAEAPIDWSKAIQSIETFNPSCGTAEGIHPGSLVVDVERILGKTSEIMRSEIEQREYITFARRPAGLVFRIDYTGVFPAGASRTTTFDPNGRILSIAVSR